MHNHPIGKFGEGVAIRFLERRGFCIIEKNVYFRCGEIDIVAKDGAVTVFIEVKTRLNQRQGGALYAFSKTKFMRFYRTVLLYRRYKHLVGEFRLDFVAVQINSKTKKAKLKHFKSISWASFGIG